MSRQILTFFLVFAGLFFLMRSCSNEPPPPDAVGRRQLRRDSDTTGRELLEDKERGVRAVFNEDGTLVSLRVGDQLIVREVNSENRTFHVVERTERGDIAKLAGWMTGPPSIRHFDNVGV